MTGHSSQAGLKMRQWRWGLRKTGLSPVRRQLQECVWFCWSGKEQQHTPPPAPTRLWTTPSISVCWRPTVDVMNLPWLQPTERAWRLSLTRAFPLMALTIHLDQHRRSKGNIGTPVFRRQDLHTPMQNPQLRRCRQNPCSWGYRACPHRRRSNDDAGISACTAEQGTT